jgi:putative redox protein
MAQHIESTVHFNNHFEGELELKEGSISIGINPNQATPYLMLQGALISCLHATFLDILTKKRESYQSITYKTSGHKREGVPATIEVLHLDVYISGVTKQVAAEKSMELASKVCSIYQTLSCVGKLSYTIHFID